MSCIFGVTWSAGDVKEPTNLSKRVGDVVPSVVVYLSFHCTLHAWVGWVSEIKNELIAQPGAPLQADVRSHSIRIVNRLETICDMCGI